MEKEYKKIKEKRMAPPVFPANAQKLRQFGGRFCIPGDKLTILLRVMRNNERHCFFAWLVDSRQCFIEGEKEVLEMSFRDRAVQSRRSK